MKRTIAMNGKIPTIYLENVSPEDSLPIFEAMNSRFGYGKWLSKDLPSVRYLGRQGKEDCKILTFLSNPENEGKVFFMEEINAALYPDKPKGVQYMAVYMGRMRNKLLDIGSKSTIGLVKSLKRGYVWYITPKSTFPTSKC